jgi:hypothetical protein
MTLSRRRFLTGIDHGSVAANGGTRRQSCFFDMRCIEDVHNALTGSEEIVRDDPPVAAPPDGFGAHDRASMLATSDSESRETGGEWRRQRVVRIVAKTTHPPIGIERRFRAVCLSTVTTKLGDVLIADLPRRQRFGEALTIELWVGPRPWHRSYVDKKIDGWLPKQIDEFSDRPGRMTYGEKCARDVSLAEEGGRQPGPHRRIS